MKPFRGTALALVALVVVAVLVWMFKPQTTTAELAEGKRLFAFEKHELIRIEVEQPGVEPIRLEEEDGLWTIGDTDKVASRSMVNRAKHQIHDLTARAIIDEPEALERYGLGKLATHITLTLRDGTALRFDVGHPNPSSVSYYIRRDSDNTVHTVKKSASDFWLMILTDPKLARENRFASFDSKDATAITTTLRLPDAAFTLTIERVGDREWEMRSPVEMSASEDRVRRLLGRVSALKARDIIDVPADALAAKKAEYGLDAPRADIAIRFASREPLHLLVGDDAPSESHLEELAYMWLEGEPDTIYVARRGMLEELGQDPQELRNRRVVHMKFDEVVGVDVTLQADEEDDLEGSASVLYRAETWFWEDGVPVPGSTPERVARALAELEVDAFIDDTPGDLAEYGLADPLARAVLTDRDGNERVVLIGGEGEPEVDPEGNERPRRYAAIEGAESVYLVSERALRVVKDMVRERARKAKKDAVKAGNREAIPSDALPDEEEL